MGRLFFLIFTTILIIVSVVISTHNTSSINIDIYLYNYDLPLSILILYSFIAGIITTLIYLMSIIISYKKRTREIKNALHNNQEELDNLRRNPLRDGTELLKYWLFQSYCFLLLFILLVKIILMIILLIIFTAQSTIAD